MFHCVICHFDGVLDDVVVANSHGHCICLRCYAREVGSTVAMSKELRRELIAALAEIAGA